jgi:hypothetical protein
MGLKIIIPKGLGFLLVHLYDFFVYMKDEWDSTKKNLQIFSILLNKSLSNMVMGTFWKFSKKIFTF